MKGNAVLGTKPELALRSALHRAGRRFRKNVRIHAPGCSVRPDIVFTRARVAVFVDGCFWHSCPEHGTTPSANASYWAAKLAGNRQRDARVDAALHAGGWEVVRLWEHVPTHEALETVLVALHAAIRLE
jgi:DNA mismatch endonuclease (patch repair protein)